MSRLNGRFFMQVGHFCFATDGAFETITSEDVDRSAQDPGFRVSGCHSKMGAIGTQVHQTIGMLDKSDVKGIVNNNIIAFFVGGSINGRLTGWRYFPISDIAESERFDLTAT